ncbi:putative membrane protein [Gottschalkia acidurici 9a]|uniref:Riboflavin transporter n=1 Tax=Gottschalkia acidurici (strain ATCC 7906 / DSM 604 / BCRC 14475 / CIP 104303 / KCTC 5404 / NCIMB 10678 / 9a) TaxID=1128398 RepID=K0AY90_GOTA9|nr:ECF transporter S component [Gottschalkia acidurici]AFS77346.1 putative membrane protein [Gottschalkia acidurici 9a]
MSKRLSLSTLVKVSLLGAISFIIMMVEFPLWFAPEFYKIDFSDLPALIGALSLGPVAGIMIELIKNLLNVVFTGSITGGIGEFANFLIGALYVGIAGYIYNKNKTKSTAIKGMILGTIVMSIIGSLLNYYVLLPIYSKVMPVEEILQWAKAVNSLVVDLKTLVIFAVLPFNLLKGAVVSIITLPIYKRLSAILHK